MSGRYAHILSTAFNRSGGRWVWYANAWSRGVIVTDDERTLYLSFSPIAFRDAIRGRPASEPRRPYWAGLRRMLTAMVWGRDPDQAAE